VFADIRPDTLTLSAANAAAAVTEKTRAVIADLPGGNPCDAKALRALCDEKGLKLILNLSDAWSAKQDGKAIYKYADAAFVDLSQGKAVDLGLAAAVITDEVENHKLFYAYHNCGRPWGVVESTLSFDEILGGDLRVAEWQASLIPGRLAQAPQVDTLCKEAAAAVAAALPEGSAIPVIPGGEAAGRGVLAKAAGAEVYPAMHLQPFFRDAYFKTLTGTLLSHAEGDFPVAEAAARQVHLLK
jgi:dTDP-4-amino-4,6-dideoxygalactose transaminase